MSQFYAQSGDEDRCRRSILTRTAITITGLTTEGQIRAFSGQVQAVETGFNLYQGYPLRVTILD